METNLAPRIEPESRIVAMTTPATLLQIAIDKGADLERLERLMDLQIKWEANEARKAYLDAKASFKAEPLEIRKRKAVGYETKEGDFVGYKHAELSDVTDVVGPACAKHGLSYSWDIKQDGGKVKVTCTLTHKLGHSESVTLEAAPDGSGKKNPIQQVASSITYLQRYTLQAVTGTAAKGDDSDAGGHDEPELMSQEHQATIQAKCEEISPTFIKNVLKSYKAQSLGDIPDAEYETIIKKLDVSIRNKQ